VNTIPEIAALLPINTEVRDGELLVGGCRLATLAVEFGTPLYVYDATTVRANCQAIRQAFAHFPLVRFNFAAKACDTPAILRLIASEGFGVDCVSLGELQAARMAGVQADSILLHGNNKSEEELQAALTQRIYAIVIDNPEELQRLIWLTKEWTDPVPVMLRVTLDLEAQTHPHLQTSGQASKFGLVVSAGELDNALQIMARVRGLHLLGLHTHLGSQLDNPRLYVQALEQLLMLMHTAETVVGTRLHEVSIGGGWAVPYQPGQPELQAHMLAAMLRPLMSGSVAESRAWTLALEPGRAIVARASVALYRVGAVKRVSRRDALQYASTREQHLLVAVDGGMGDNPRPALYGARYCALLPLRMDETATYHCDIVGRYCEAGDVLAWDVELPEPHVGDLLAIPVSGAYQLTMASNYNLVPRPAAVLVDNGEARLITRRETIEDMLAREILPCS
jgi:diaminopimelate decarboxylase